jgi:hypothetical protein
MRLVAISSKWQIRVGVGGALLLGVVAGLVLSRQHEPVYAFLDGATPTAIRDGSVVTSSGVIRGSTTYYSFQGDWLSVYQRARLEMPNAIERTGTVDGKTARILTEPRFEDGHMRVFFPPVKEVAILPQKLVLSEGGQLMAQEDSRPWASVKISEYHQPYLLESAVDWVRDHIDI